MRQSKIDAMNAEREKILNRVEAAVLKLDPTAKLSFHHIGPAEWYEVRSGDGKLLGEADASTVLDGDITAWRNAWGKLVPVTYW
jgi:hypothetical protein